MRIRPSRYSVILAHVGTVSLWEDASGNLFLPWWGVQGKVFPVDPSSGTVMTEGVRISAPHGHPEPAPAYIIVEDVPTEPVSALCQERAPAGSPEWLQQAYFKITTLAPVTLLEKLTCVGVG